MMPPTSIDGTDITGATIDGTDVQEITVDGQTVFTAESPVIDDFESGNLNAYTNTSNFSVTSNTVIQGSFSLELNNPNNNFDMYSEPGDGLANYPEKGQKFSLLFFDSNETNPAFLFGVDGPNQNGYGLFHLPNFGDTGFFRIDGGNFTELFRTSTFVNNSEWYEYEVQWHDGSGSLPDNTLEVSIFEIDSNLNRTNQIFNTSVVDSTYPTNKGIGFADGVTDPLGNGFIDNCVILGQVD